MATIKYLIDERKKYVTKDKKNIHRVALYIPDNKQTAHIMAYNRKRDKHNQDGDSRFNATIC